MNHREMWALCVGLNAAFAAAGWAHRGLSVPVVVNVVLAVSFASALLHTRRRVP